jgi:hypothetical protein
MAFLLAKPTPHNVNHDNDRFSMFNKKRDITGLPDDRRLIPYRPRNYRRTVDRSRDRLHVLAVIGREVGQNGQGRKPHLLSSSSGLGT